MVSITTRIVEDIKTSLSKELEKSKDASDNDPQHAYDMLQRLGEIGIDLDILKETLIGTVVSKFKSYPDAQVSTLAKTLISKWKKMAKEGGIVNDTSKNNISNSNGNGNGNANDSKSKSTTVASTSNNKKLLKSSSTLSTSSDKNNTTLTSSTTTTKSSSNSKNNQPIDEEIENANLPNLRKSMVLKFHEIFQLSQTTLLQEHDMNPQALSHILASTSLHMEQAVLDYSNQSTDSNYKDKMRTLTFNLRKNLSLCQDILLTHVTPESVVRMDTTQLATADKKEQLNAKLASLKDSRRLDWEQANESKINQMCGIKGDLLKASLFTCGRCKSEKTTSTQKQTRSADEPMTVFVLCLNCGNRWKC